MQQRNTSQRTENAEARLTVMFSPSYMDKENGRFPNISVNSKGVVVEMYHKPWFFSTMMWRVGSVESDTIKFRGDRPNYMSKGGIYPRVAINDEGVVVEVHESPYRRQSWYRVGTISDDSTNTINWAQEDKNLNLGCRPAVTINNTHVVAVAQSAYWGLYHVYYKVGKVDKENRDIIWEQQDGETLEIFNRSRVEELSISMNNHGDIVAVGRIVDWRTFVLRVGCLKDSEGKIEWGTVQQLEVGGYTPSVTINDDKHVLLVNQSTWWRRLRCSYGVLSTSSKHIQWKRSDQTYDYGTYPSVAMTSGGTIVEVHETNSTYRGDKMFNHTGKLEVKN